MELQGKDYVSKKILAYEISAFVIIILIIWLDEIIDIPYLLLGAEATPINWRESLFESVIILILGAIILRMTLSVFRKLRYLEGLLHVCASCKKIEDASGIWQPIEVYVRDRTDAAFTHGVCPECAELLYPDYNPYKKKTKS